MTAEIIAQLKKSDMSPYALPWFMVLGPKNSGKSTLLKYSGLSYSWEYDLSEDCKWLFSDSAIFIEVNFGIEQASWKALWIFLKKYRPRCLLNGIMLVLNLSPESESETISVKFIRDYLAEITDLSGYLFPITTVFTHIDSITGFEEFFSHQSQLLFQYHENVYEKLFSGMFKIAQAKSAITAKLKVLNFPENFRAYEHKLNLFMAELVRDNPYQDTPNFKHFYITGVLDKPYFIAPVFEQTIRESSDNPQVSRKKLWFLRWLTSASIATASIIILSVFFIASASFAHSTMILHQGIRLGLAVENSSNSGADNREDSVNLLNYLSNHPPEDLEMPLQTILLNNIEHQLIPNVFHDLETQLAITQERWALATSEEAELMRGDYYNLLKIYVMFCHPQSRYPQFYQGNSMMAFYLNHSHKNWPERADLVQLSQQQLGSSSEFKNIYAGLKSWGEKQSGFMSANDLIGSNSVDVDNDVKLPVFYTARGFDYYALPEINRLSKNSPDALKDNLLAHYKLDYKNSWISFLQALQPASGEHITVKTSRKLLALAHQNILFEDINLADYYKSLSHLKPQDTQALDVVNNTVQAINDPVIREAIRNVLLLPLRAEYKNYLDKISVDLASAWKSQVYNFYAQKLAHKYPFMISSSSSEEISPEDLEQFFNYSQGIFWLYVHQKLVPYLSGNWLGVKMDFSSEFLKSLAQAKNMNSQFDFEIYPEPTLGLKEIRFLTNNQTYRYRNDPQEWQSFHWILDPTNADTVLEIMTSNGSSGSIEINSSWGLFRLLQKAALSRNSDGSFRARWKIRADNGHVYSVSFLFKTNKFNNLFDVVLFDHFRVPEEIFKLG